MKKLLLMTLILLVSATLIMGCGKSTPAPAPAPATTQTPAQVSTQAPTAAEPQPKHGGTLIQVHSSTPTNLGYTPKITGPTYSQVWACIEPLLRCDNEGNIVGHLATDWSTGPDGKFITLNLRKGVKFHDGTDFNAEAVKYNLDLRKATNPAELPGVTSIDVIDTHTIRLNTNPYSSVVIENLYAHAGLIASPAHLAKGEDAVKFHPVGTGPFKFVEFKRDVHTKYVKFDGYWQKGQPYFDAYEIIVIPDATTRLATLLKGEVNIIMPSRKDASELIKEGYPVIPTKTGLQGFITESGNPASPFANIKVRMAIEYAIDKKAITDSLGYGLLIPAYQYTQIDSDVYNPDLARRYDVAKARQLLAEAGYPNGFKTQILSNSGFTDADTMALVKHYLAQVGIEASVDMADMGRYTEWRRGGWTNGMVFMNDGLLQMLNTRSCISGYISETSKDYVSMLRPPGWQDLINKALYAKDPAEERALTKQMVQQVYDDATILPLWYTVVTTATVPKVNVNVYHNLPGRPFSMWDAHFK